MAMFKTSRELMMRGTPSIAPHSALWLASDPSTDPSLRKTTGGGGVNTVGGSDDIGRFYEIQYSKLKIDEVRFIDGDGPSYYCRRKLTITPSVIQNILCYFCV
jgi:hypothetical protein